MKSSWRDRLIAAVTFFGGLYFVLDFVLPKNLGSFEFGKYTEQISIGVGVVGTMAFGLGLINIFMVHGGRITKGQRGWWNSLALIAGLLLMLVIQSSDFRNSLKDRDLWKPLSDYALFVEQLTKKYSSANAEAEGKTAILMQATEARISEMLEEMQLWLSSEHDERTLRMIEMHARSIAQAKESQRLLYAAYRGQGDVVATGAQVVASLKELASLSNDLVATYAEQRTSKKLYGFLNKGFFVPLGAAMFSLLAFYIANAAYRSFRVRSVEASVMMFTAIVVILGQIPHGPLYISEHLPRVRLWLLMNVTTPGNRAIYFGAAIAGFAMAIRMWLSLEKNPLADEDEIAAQPLKGKGRI